MRLNQEMQKLYAEHGVNPLAGLVGCLPLIVQLPILTALYYVFMGFAQAPRCRRTSCSSPTSTTTRTTT